MKVDLDLPRSFAPVFLRTGFTVQQASAIASSIAAVVHATAREQDKKIREATSSVIRVPKHRKDIHAINLEGYEVAEAAFDEIERRDEATAELRKDIADDDDF